MDITASPARPVAAIPNHGRPTLFRSLVTLARLGVVPTCIIDVGAGADTSALRSFYPDLHHHLFEPETALLPTLAANYANVPHTIYPIAVGDPSLDELLGERGIAGPLLLKVDVDGTEIEVLRGAWRTLRQAAVVVIEAPLIHLARRATFLEEAGFTLFDIVDLSYYDDQMWQVDIVAVPTEAIGKPPFNLLCSQAVDPVLWNTIGYS